MRTIAILAMGLALCVVGASGARAQGLPTVVRTAIQGMDGDCRDAGGTPGDKAGLLKSGDWNGDGVRDWALDEAAYVCDGSAGLFSGSAGGSVDVYAGLAGGAVSEPVYFSAFGAELDAGRLWLSVEGADCGQTNTARIAHVDYIHCDRTIAWVGGKFAFAPLSVVRPTGGQTASPPPPAPAPAPARAATTGVSTAWLTGAWVTAGQACDSDLPEFYGADGALSGYGMQGRWRLEGDVLNATWHTEDEDGTRGPEQTARHRVARLGQDRLTMTPLGRGAPVTMTRCS
jgi:hypothetical protein